MNIPSGSANDLSDQLRRHRLLAQGQVEHLAELMARFPDSRALARELIHRGWLTPYQANQLLQGRGNELVLGSYILLERIGEGGMGQVFKARNWKLGRLVALKLIKKERLTNDDAARRFQREIQTAAQLSHPNIVHAHDADEVNGTHFFVMEYVEGTDLAKLVKQTGPLPVEAACDYVRQAALGLQHAYERGMVHRDIKPHNLLVTREGKVKVLDMGLARLVQPAEAESGSSMTETGCIMGTPDYMAPEQARDSHSADIRADLYALGCTLYFLLTGRVPFPRGTVTEKLLQHNMNEPLPVEQHRPEVPEGVAAVVRRLMAKRPEDRYQTPGELATALAGQSTGPLGEATVSKPGRTIAAAMPAGGVLPAAEDTVNQALDFRPTEQSIQLRQAEIRSRRQTHNRLLPLATLGILGALVVLLLVCFSPSGSPPSQAIAPKKKPIPPAEPPYEFPKSTIAYYRFEEGEGIEVVNSVNRATDGIHDAEYVADCPLVKLPGASKRNEWSLRFAGSSKANFSSIFPFHQGAGDATLEFWLNVPDQLHHSIFWSTLANGDINRFNISINPKGHLGCDYRSPSGALHTLLAVNGNFTVPLHTWVHIAISRSTNRYYFYRDRVLIHVGEDPNPDLPSGGGWSLGGRKDGSGVNFIGLIDEVRFSNKALFGPGGHPGP